MPDGKTFEYRIVTPERVLAQGTAHSMAIPGWDGEIGILHNRAPLLVRLQPGIVRVQLGDDEKWFFIGGGFAEIAGNEVIVLTPRAALPEQAALIDTHALRAEAGRVHVTDAASAMRQSSLYAEIRAVTRLATRTPAHY